MDKNVGIPIIASIFADTFIYYDVIRQAADLKAHELLARECDPQERSDALFHRKEAESKCRLVDRMRVWKHKPSDVIAESISIGDIRVTPFSNCHSIYDSHIFLIEADGKRIWHTGDYREHGYRGKDLFPTLEEYATDIDVLITEGTMLKSEGRCIHERRVSDEMQHEMQAFKYAHIVIVIVTLVVYQISDVLFAYILEFVEEQEEQQEENAA